MSLSTKCLHPVPTVRIHAISKIERVFLETRMLLKKGYQPILYQPPRALCKVRWVLHELIYWCSQAVLFYWFQKEIGQKIPCILIVVCKQFIRNIKVHTYVRKFFDYVRRIDAIKYTYNYLNKYVKFEPWSFMNVILLLCKTIFAVR